MVNHPAKDKTRHGHKTKRIMTEEQYEEQLLNRLFEQVSQHLETRWEYFTLTTTEKSSGIAANIAGGLVLAVFALLVLFFFTFGFAWWIGDLIGHRAGGFALTGLIFIPIAGLAFWWIRPFVRSKIIEIALDENDKTKPADHA